MNDCSNSKPPPEATTDLVEGTTRPRILLVDDLPANLGVLLTFLEGAGYEVLLAASGDGALARLPYMQPDIILLDVNMPGMDGYETCRRLKADARWRETPVLFLTSLHDPVDKVRGFKVGAVDYITKPLHPEEVLARVHSHLQIRALQQALAEKNELLEHAMARRLEAEAQLQQGLDRAVLVVDDEGQIEFCTRLARRLLDRYFPDEAAGPNILPGPLSRWLASGPAGGRWQTDLAESRLEAQLFTPGQPGGCLMLLLEEKMFVTNSPARLLCLGLTAREAEVLYWVAHGKTNQEVAIILSASLNTIKKHVVNILVKIGAENRLVAALQATEILERSTWEQTRSLVEHGA